MDTKTVVTTVVTSARTMAIIGGEFAAISKETVSRRKILAGLIAESISAMGLTLPEVSLSEVNSDKQHRFDKVTWGCFVLTWKVSLGFKISDTENPSEDEKVERQRWADSSERQCWQKACSDVGYYGPKGGSPSLTPEELARLSRLSNSFANEAGVSMEELPALLGKVRKFTLAENLRASTAGDSSKTVTPAPVQSAVPVNKLAVFTPAQLSAFTPEQIKALAA